MNENEQKQQGLQIELSPDKAQGEYANFAIITHSSSEFIVDFARMLPGLPKAQVRSALSWLQNMPNVCWVLCRKISCAMSVTSAPSRCRSRSKNLAPFLLLVRGKERLNAFSLIVTK